MSAPPQPLRGEFCEPSLHKVEPARIGGREVQREAGMANQPSLDRRPLVGRGVVEDEVDIEMCEHRLVDDVEEPTELLSTLPRGEVCDHIAGCDVQGGVEIGSAGALVVVRAPLWDSRHQWQH